MTPKTYLIGFTTLDSDGLAAYLADTGQQDFVDSMKAAADAGHSPGEILCSFYAKLCYRSLILGKNSNITRVRDVTENLRGIVNSGHGAVLEHCVLNFVTTNCSRVFTHELVRHRVGTAFSQTSGRYCTVEDAELVLPPELEDADLGQCPHSLEVNGPCGRNCELCHGDNIWTVATSMRQDLDRLKKSVAKYREALKLDDPGTSFEKKKRLTSALRRIMPNGATNEIGWSCNLRSLRHLIELRTSRHAEWEIRLVFNQVADIVNRRWEHMLCGAQFEVVDGLNEYTNLKV